MTEVASSGTMLDWFPGGIRLVRAGGTRKSPQALDPSWRAPGDPPSRLVVVLLRRCATTEMKNNRTAGEHPNLSYSTSHAVAMISDSKGNRSTSQRIHASSCSSAIWPAPLLCCARSAASCAADDDPIDLLQAVRATYNARALIHHKTT
ncbi:hypothetical protein M409DRAFT_53076 [Zasmidium cellare ATCC 36951]|uniref:Uncharacterized protein n=1 Tax=Zasmidium cellare ATCC 36951 TaxID=1080233 RepID=A0A6A6CMC1_ZASCE|nr:uncharacterized protein M409DRAFT_53076 [Zasmidium cellare ATCC 36951]KAF2168387.1 hypothetical protein M409DRAFT_53076 [Zasmidium cellare ATCC 36951]